MPQSAQEHKCICEGICAFVRIVARRLPPVGNSKRESAHNETSLTICREFRMCVNTHITKEVHLEVWTESIQVCIRFGLDNRITLAGFCFQATAAEKCDHPSTVTN